MEFEKTTRSPFYKDLRMVFMNGTAEEFAKQYFISGIGIANDFLRDRKAYSVDEAFDMAEREMQKQLKAMNPNRGTFLKQTKDKRKPMEWILWLKKHPRAKEIMPELYKLETEYINKLEQYKSQMPFYARKLKIPKLFKKYDWEIPSR